MKSFFWFLLVWDWISCLAAGLPVWIRWGPGEGSALWAAGCAVLWGAGCLGGSYRRFRPRLSFPAAQTLGICLLAGAGAGWVHRAMGFSGSWGKAACFSLLLGWLTLLGRALPARMARLRTLRLRRDTAPGCRRIAVYGAGELGRYLAEKLSLSPGEGLVPVVFLDDDPSLRGRRLGDIPVKGGLEDLPCLAQWMALDQLIVAIHSLSPARLAQAAVLCREAGITLRRFGIAGGPDDLQLARFYQIRPEQLLGRAPADLDCQGAARLLRGQTVLVTGGAGSIGSELCLQALRFGAGLVVAVDIWENGLFALGEKLGEEFPPERFRLEIGSVRDRERLLRLMTRYRPQTVFHAAAHKHVPLAEENPCEGVKNNLLGTILTARAARTAGAERFLLISTDKAVNPSSVMGATKRLCEMALQLLAREGASTVFASVRFGNVLGSHGSVVPLFQRQIAAGGPVTVTDPAALRYFMTIPEAVGLVLEAASMARGGEIFLLDMGEPVSILELAREMIRLWGLRPGTDIPIVFTGLRPGEKLREELTLAEEIPCPTQCPRISMVRPLPLDGEGFWQAVDTLAHAARQEDHTALLRELRRLFPTLSVPGEGREDLAR